VFNLISLFSDNASEKYLGRNVTKFEALMISQLTGESQPKISDFGLSRFLAKDEVHKTSASNNLPIRWMVLHTVLKGTHIH
jgi:hypothetical protein